MKISNEMKRAMEEVAEECWEYSFFGIRVQRRPFEMGEISHCSHIWDDGVDTGEELDGICVTDLRFDGRIPGEYIGEHAALIGGTLVAYGEDAGELILKDAEVLYIAA